MLPINFVMGQQLSMSRKKGRKTHKLFKPHFLTNRNSILSHTFALFDDEPIVDLININSSNEKELLKVPEIDVELSKNIIKHRRTIGYYQKVEDLVVVPGMGAERLNRIKHHFSTNNKSVMRSFNQSFDSLKSVDSQTLITKLNKSININRSSIFELQMVQGVTQEIAAAIIDYRNKKGQFEKLEDLRKIKCIDYIRLDNIIRYLTLHDNEDDISETQTECNSGEIILNGYNRFNEGSMKHPSTNGTTNGITTPVLADIFELLSIYSSRPILNEIFRNSRNGRQAFRLSSWNLENFSVEKASNLGVKEVVCRTVLENGWSILAIQNVEWGEALNLICDELNEPKLQRVDEWKNNSRHWKYNVLECENGNLGFIYDTRGGNGTKLLSSEKGPPELDQFCESMVTSFEINNSEVKILNLKVKLEAKLIEVQDFIQNLLKSETNYIICGDFGSCMKHLDSLSNLEHSRLVLMKNTRNHLHSRSNFPKYSTSNFIINASIQKHFTGFNGVIRHGLTHLAIPSGWSWGGYVSSYCPIWVEFFVNPDLYL